MNSIPDLNVRPEMYGMLNFCIYILAALKHFGLRVHRS